MGAEVEAKGGVGGGGNGGAWRKEEEGQEEEEDARKKEGRGTEDDDDATEGMRGDKEADMCGLLVMNYIFVSDFLYVCRLPSTATHYLIQRKQEQSVACSHSNINDKHALLHLFPRSCVLRFITFNTTSFYLLPLPVIELR